MLAIVARLSVALVAIAGVAVVVAAPWKQSPPSEFSDANGAPLADDGSFMPVPGMDGSDAMHMVRYEMPQPNAVPALPDGTSDLSWPDLWADGPFKIEAAGDRVGTPDRTLFPEGSTAEDVTNFFLDIADMRSMQMSEGAIRPELDGKRVRIAGYTTPVGFAENETSFLLVPELGACIHVPPPPPNQIVYVEKAANTPQMFAAVWVTGTLRADPIATILADVGYRLEDVTTEPYR